LDIKVLDIVDARCNHEAIKAITKPLPGML